MQFTKSTAAIAAALSCALVAGSVSLGSAWAQETEEGTAHVAVGYYGDYEGYETLPEWEAAIEGKIQHRHDYLNGILEKMNERDDVDWEDLRTDAIKIYQDLDHVYSISSVDEIKEALIELNSAVDEAIEERDAEIAAEEEAARIAEEEAAAAAYYYSYDSGYYSGGGGYSSGGLRSAGVLDNGNGTQLTWYSQRVLSGGGLSDLNSNGRHVDDDGYIRDGDGYIAVASSDYGQGTVVDLPALGEGVQGKVYDSGCSSGTIDVYTDW